MQFGDDILDDVRSTLERKNLWKREYHLNRLQDEGMVPLSRRFASHRDPEEQATEAFDRPPPPPGPPPDHAPARERERHRRPDEPEGGYDTAEEGVVEQPSSSILTSLSSGANSTLADMGAGLVHGTAYLAGAAAGAVGKGLVRGITHLATGSSSIEHHGGGEEAGSEAEEVLRAYPKAKARAGKSASSGSKDAPFPFPSRPWVDPSSYNGTGAHAFYIGDDDDRSPPRPAAAAAAAAAAPSRPSRPIAQRDVRFAQETLASLPANDYGRGRRRAPGRGG